MPLGEGFRVLCLVVIMGAVSCFVSSLVSFRFLFYLHPIGWFTSLIILDSVVTELSQKPIQTHTAMYRNRTFSSTACEKTL